VTAVAPEALASEVFARLAAELGRRLRIGSLFTGYGGLDLAVEEVTGGEVVWVCDPDPGARSGLWAHFARAIAELRPRFVVIENVYGLLGAKAGRSADAVDPDLAALLEGDAADPEALAELETLVHEHQEGTDAEAAADPAGDELGSDDGDVGDGDARPGLLRAMGAVLGDLADLGYDATWVTVAGT
jgi:site-specific DNA-cytosine methylase